jgi:photosystem II stability/assembly factor-like uncharacterized protein
MHTITRFAAAILLAVLALVACNATPTPDEQALSTDAIVELIPTAIPSQTPPPTEIPPTQTPTEEPVDTAIPLETLPPPVPPPGPTLERLPAGQELVFTRLYMIDQLSGWATGGVAGSNDHLFITGNGGSTWRDVTPPQPGEPGTLAIAVFLKDDWTAWATYYGESMDVLFPPWPVVWSTNDAGSTWQPSQLLDLTGLEYTYQTELVFADYYHGWLLTHVGAGMSHDYVTLFRTTDGGSTWERILDPYNDGQIQGCQKTGLVFVDSQVGWLTGDCGGVMAGAFLNRTTDGGLTWTYIDLPAPTDQPLLFDVNTWAACGTYDLHFSYSNPQNAFLGVRCTQYAQDSPDPIYSNYMYTTGDGGATWTSQPYPGGTLLFVWAQHGWALSRDIYQTTDGGLTWNLVNDVHWDAHFDFVTDQLGWAASYTETEYAFVVTMDGGAHWSIIEPVVAP